MTVIVTACVLLHSSDMSDGRGAGAAHRLCDLLVWLCDLLHGGVDRPDGM